MRRRGAGVVGRAGAGVIDRQVDGQHDVAERFEFRRQKFPAPGAVPGTVN